VLLPGLLSSVVGPTEAEPVRTVPAGVVLGTRPPTEKVTEAPGAKPPMYVKEAVDDWGAPPSAKLGAPTSLLRVTPIGS
jgi:hypothetical protein